MVETNAYTEYRSKWQVRVDGSSRAPSAVSSTLLVVRSTSFRPSPDSSAASDWESDG